MLSRHPEESHESRGQIPNLRVFQGRKLVERFGGEQVRERTVELVLKARNLNVETQYFASVGVSIPQFLRALNPPLPAVRDHRLFFVSLDCHCGMGKSLALARPSERANPWPKKFT